MPHKLIRNLLILGSLTRTSAFVSARRHLEYTAPNNTGALLPFTLFTCCPENSVRHAPRGQGHSQLAQVFLSSVCSCRMLSLQPNTGSIFGRVRRWSSNMPQVGAEYGEIKACRRAWQPAISHLRRQLSGHRVTGKMSFRSYFSTNNRFIHRTSSLKKPLLIALVLQAVKWI